MKRAGFTNHAARRLQQRGIPSLVVDLLETYGSVKRAGGADLLFFDKPAKRRLQFALGGGRNMKVLDQWLRVYAVLGDSGSYVTVAHDTRRRRR